MHAVLFHRIAVIACVYTMMMFMYIRCARQYIPAVSVVACGSE